MISFLLILTLLWFIFDVNSRIDVLQYPEKYSFRANFASHIVQQDYYMSKQDKNDLTIYNELKNNDNKYADKTDKNSAKYLELNNIAFDVYHDVLSMNYKNKYSMSFDDCIFLFKNNGKLAIDIVGLKDDLMPKLEETRTLFNELNSKKDVIRVVREDLQKRKIKATIDINDVNFENLSPINLDDKNKPQYLKEFDKVLDKIIDKDYQDFEKNVKKCYELPVPEDRVACYIKAKEDKGIKFWQDIDKLDESWKHRYTVLAIENKKNGDKVQHLYNVHSFKEGNRYYWDIQYYPPNSEYIKAYLEMLKLLMNF